MFIEKWNLKQKLINYDNKQRFESNISLILNHFNLFRDFTTLTYINTPPYMEVLDIRFAFPNYISIFVISQSVGVIKNLVFRNTEYLKEISFDETPKKEIIIAPYAQIGLVDINKKIISVNDDYEEFPQNKVIITLPSSILEIKKRQWSTIKNLFSYFPNSFITIRGSNMWEKITRANHIERRYLKRNEEIRIKMNYDCSKNTEENIPNIKYAFYSIIKTNKETQQLKGLKEAYINIYDQWKKEKNENRKFCHTYDKFIQTLEKNDLYHFRKYNFIKEINKRNINNVLKIIAAFNSFAIFYDIENMLEYLLEPDYDNNYNNNNYENQKSPIKNMSGLMIAAQYNISITAKNFLELYKSTIFINDIELCILYYMNANQHIIEVLSKYEAGLVYYKTEENGSKTFNTALRYSIERNKPASVELLIRNKAEFIANEVFLQNNFLLKNKQIKQNTNNINRKYTQLKKRNNINIENNNDPWLIKPEEIKSREIQLISAIINNFISERKYKEIVNSFDRENKTQLIINNIINEILNGEERKRRKNENTYKIDIDNIINNDIKDNYRQFYLQFQMQLTGHQNARAIICSPFFGNLQSANLIHIMTIFPKFKVKINYKDDKLLHYIAKSFCSSNSIIDELYSLTKPTDRKNTFDELTPLITSIIYNNNDFSLKIIDRLMEESTVLKQLANSLLYEETKFPKFSAIIYAIIQNNFYVTQKLLLYYSKFQESPYFSSNKITPAVTAIVTEASRRILKITYSAEANRLHKEEYKARKAVTPLMAAIQNWNIEALSIIMRDTNKTFIGIRSAQNTMALHKLIQKKKYTISVLSYLINEEFEFLSPYDINDQELLNSLSKLAKDKNYTEAFEKINYEKIEDLKNGNLDY